MVILDNAVDQGGVYLISFEWDPVVVLHICMWTIQNRARSNELQQACM
jgi:hypothetical protein